MVSGAVAAEYFIPDHQQCVEGVKHLGKRTGIKRETRRLGGRPERKTKIGKTGQQINLVLVIEGEEIVADHGVLAVHREDVAKKIQDGPAEDGYGKEKSARA